MMGGICSWSLVAPRAGAWIETGIDGADQVDRRPSPLAQGRGSKPKMNSLLAWASSRPSRRGVDRNMIRASRLLTNAGRPSRRGVDRNAQLHVAMTFRTRRPSRRGVDRNRAQGFSDGYEIVAPRAGAWIETAPTSRSTRTMQRRPSRRGVDRNCGPARRDRLDQPSPLAQGRGSKLRICVNVE